VGRGNEDDALDRREGLEEHRRAHEVAHLGLHLRLQLFERNIRHVFPEVRAAADRHEAGEQPALAVADNHHAAQRRIGARGVYIFHHSFQSPPQKHRRIENRLSRVVLEDPELIAPLD
jgi:hypothetical protein